jgi:hypothetical protein
VVELNRVNGRHTDLSGSVCMADDVVVDTADEHIFRSPACTNRGAGQHHDVPVSW